MLHITTVRTIILTHLYFFFKTYDAQYEEELYRRIAEETKNKTRYEKAIEHEKKKKEKVQRKSLQISESNKIKESKKEAKRQLEIEMRHQEEEAETRALGQAMVSDAAAGRTTFNQSSTNLLNNFQGNDVFQINKIIISV